MEVRSTLLYSTLFYSIFLFTNKSYAYLLFSVSNVDFLRLNSHKILSKYPLKLSIGVEQQIIKQIDGTINS